MKISQSALCGFFYILFFTFFLQISPLLFSLPLYYLDGKQIDYRHLRKNPQGEVYILASSYAELTGNPVHYDSLTGRILIEVTRGVLQLRIGSDEVDFNQTPNRIKVPVVLIGEDPAFPLDDIIRFSSRDLIKSQAGVIKPISGREDIYLQTIKRAEEPEPEFSKKTLEKIRPLKKKPGQLYDYSEFHKNRIESIQKTSMNLDSDNRLIFSLNFQSYLPEGYEDYMDFDISHGKSSLMPGISVMYGFTPNWLLEYGGSYSNTRVQSDYRGIEGDNILRNGTLRVEMIPFRLRLRYSFNNFYRIKPFLGVGYVHSRVRMQYLRDGINEIFDRRGKTDGFTAIGGLEWRYVPDYSLSLSFEYLNSDTSFDLSPQINKPYFPFSLNSYQLGFSLSHYWW